MEQTGNLRPLGRTPYGAKAKGTGRGRTGFDLSPVSSRVLRLVSLRFSAPLCFGTRDDTVATLATLDTRGTLVTRDTRGTLDTRDTLVTLDTCDTLVNLDTHVLVLPDWMDLPTCRAL